jgi:hypothetical protein
MTYAALHLSAPAPGTHVRSEGAYVRVRWLLAASVALMAIAQLVRIPVLTAGSKPAPLYLHDLAIATVLGVAALCHLRGRPLRVDRTAALAALFALVGGTSAVLAVPRFGLSAFEVAFSLAYLARWAAYFAVYLVVINFVRGDQVAALWRVLLGTVLAITAFGVVQAALLPNFAQIVYPEARLYLDWDPQGHRLVSTLLDPNYVGALIVLVLLPVLGMVAFGARVRPWVVALLVLGLALTLSRGAVLGFAAGLLLIVGVRGIPRSYLRYGALGLLVLVLAAPAVVRMGVLYNKFYIDASALSRVWGWLRSLELIAQYPLLGVGFNTLGFVQQKLLGLDEIVAASFGLDGGLLVVAVLTGTVGLTIYLWMIGSVIARARSLWRDSAALPRTRGLAVGVAAATLAMLVQGFFFNTLFAPFLQHTLIVLWGMVAVLHRGASRREAVFS